LELKAKAEQAHQELEAKTRELELLEAALSSANDQAAKSDSNIIFRKPGEGESREARANTKDLESKIVIERHLRIIRRLEDQLQESDAARAKLTEQVSELREDLARDEEIFAQKQDEIQKLTAQVQDLSSQLDASKLQIDELIASRSDQKSVHQSVQYSQAAVPVASRQSFPAGLHAQDPRASVMQDEGLSVTMQQQANVRLASLVDENDSVRVGDDLLDSHHTKSARPAVPFRMDGQQILEKGFAALEAEKERLANEKRVLEEEAHALTRRFHVDQHHAERRVKALEFNIHLKQDLIRQLVRNEQGLQVVNEEQRNRIKELERDIEGIRTERDRTSTSSSGTRTKVEDMTPENRRIRDQFTAKLRTREMELDSLKKQYDESLRALKLQEQKEKRIKALESEVLKMAQQCDHVKSKAKDEAERFEKMRANHASKMRELKSKMDTRVKELEAENEKQREALQRKNDELDDVRSALKARSDRFGRPDERPESARKKEWLDNEIGELLRKKQAMDQLEKELKQREAILADKEDASRRRAGLQLKKGRKEEEVRQSVRGLEDQISHINAQIRSRQEEGRQGRSDEENLEILRCETAALQEQREDAMRARAAMEETLRTGAYLGDEEEALLAELEERMDNLDMQIEYKGQAIAELQDEVARQHRGTKGLDSILRGAPLEGLGDKEARSMLGKCVERVVNLTEELRTREAEMRTLREREEDMTDQLQSLRAAELDWDRRFTELQREHEERVRSLVEQMRQRALEDTGEHGSGREDSSAAVRALEEQVSTLSKDNFYYKQSCANLKRRLREAAAEADRDREALEKATARASQLEAQLVNYKAFVGSTSGAAQVRVSRQELRALTPEDVQALRSSRGQPPG